MKFKFKQISLRAAAASILALAAFGSYAATSANNTANATVVTPIGITAGVTLEFGSIANSGTAGSVVVTAGGVRSATNVQLLGGGTVRAATFTVSGESGKTYAVTVPSSAVTLTGVTPANTMSLGTFTYAAASGATPTVGASGDTVSVGGTLSVGATQAKDTYSGSFTVSVAYN